VTVDSAVTANVRRVTGRLCGQFRPRLLWPHGRGFTGRSVSGVEYVCSRLVLLVGITIVSLEYRLASEHPSPAALHDTCDALGWLA
jgi:acetyl esterase/lipase